MAAKIFLNKPRKIKAHIKKEKPPGGTNRSQYIKSIAFNLDTHLHSCCEQYVHACINTHLATEDYTACFHGSNTVLILSN